MQTIDESKITNVQLQQQRGSPPQFLQTTHHFGHFRRRRGLVFRGRTTTNTASSPAKVPSTPGGCHSSNAAATALARPDSVRKKMRWPGRYDVEHVIMERPCGSAPSTSDGSASMAAGLA